MGRKRVSITSECNTARNQRFQNNYNRQSMTRNQFVKEINSGNYSNYYTRNINGVETPVSNSDSTLNNFKKFYYSFSCICSRWAIEIQFCFIFHRFRKKF